MTWLTMTDGVCIDVAVAQATQTLQQLQQQQAALYSGMGAKYMPLDCKVRCVIVPVGN